MELRLIGLVTLTVNRQGGEECVRPRTTMTNIIVDVSSGFTAHNGDDIVFVAENRCTRRVCECDRASGRHTWLIGLFLAVAVCTTTPSHRQPPWLLMLVWSVALALDAATAYKLVILPVATASLLASHGGDGATDRLTECTVRYRPTCVVEST